MNFFLDNMMSPKLARALSILYGHDHRIEHVRTEGRFQANTKDAVWMGALCQDEESWAIVSGDIRMLNNPSIIAELHKSNNVFFCMDHHWCSANDYHSQTWKLIKIWPLVMELSAGTHPAFYEIQTATMPKIEEMRSSKRARRRRIKLMNPNERTGPAA